MSAHNLITQWQDALALALTAQPAQELSGQELEAVESTLRVKSGLRAGGKPTKGCPDTINYPCLVSTSGC